MSNVTVTLDDSNPEKEEQPTRAHIIVVGNAKGGSGKSTTAMHIIISLLTMGFKVGAIDLDGKQKTLGRYIENRQSFIAKKNLQLPMPSLKVIEPSPKKNMDEAQTDERARFVAALQELVYENNFVVVDCPGADSFISKLGHSFADTLLTPMNDSFIDLDLLATVNGSSLEVEKPSWYSEMVWEQRKRRALIDNHKIDWVVMRNRLSHTDAHNKRHIEKILKKLAARISFRSAPGFGERVVFRELFLKGLTMLDLNKKGVGVKMSMSHVAARHELRHLIKSLNLPGLEDKVEKL
ncbi:division plane positioning ATPase MipZ [Sneathiella sp.]|uniref:division plane positioning ATPase MipZ n=1 Tax=Sneathiella sp. TaxID=1964365 RepID=UPI0026062639|nr:division plane positioning ATPase MipZ [Sneathiella sp.]MDF2366937.1 division plane positioning ATPase MipZ [Sneathiella sp.]